MSVPAVPLMNAMVTRSAVNLRRIPTAVVPLVVMPVFFTIVFAGTFRGLTELPGYPTDNIYNWMVPYACVQTASFGALGAAFALGRDLEGGFYDRLLLSPARRWVMPASGMVWSVTRVSIPLVITLTIGTIGGMTYPGGVEAVLWLAVAAAGVAVMGGLWGLGVMYRVQKQSAGGLVQIGLFVAMFLSIGTVPLDLMVGWLPKVARWNPVTPILTLACAGFVGPDPNTVNVWSDIWPGLVSILVCSILLAWWAARGMRRLTP